MFDIEYKGGNGVIIATKKSTLVIDPKLSEVGLKDIAVKESIELSTESRFALNTPTARIVIDGPGEYEVGDFSIRGTTASLHIDAPNSEKLGTIYRIEVGDVRIALLGNIAPKLSETQLEELGVIDILIVPVGGGGLTLDATSAASLVRQIEPKAVVPTHYADSAVAYEIPQETLELFVKELGAPQEMFAKYKVKAASSLPSVMTVIEVTRS